MIGGVVRSSAVERRVQLLLLVDQRRVDEDGAGPFGRVLIGGIQRHIRVAIGVGHRRIRLQLHVHAERAHGKVVLAVLALAELVRLAPNSETWSTERFSVLLKCAAGASGCAASVRLNPPCTMTASGIGCSPSPKV